MRRLLATGTAGMLMLGVLAGCSSGDSGGIGKVKVNKNGKELTVKDGNNSFSIGDAKLPANFPKRDVPLPAGTLKAVVSGKTKGNAYFSLTYTIKSGDLRSAAKGYQRALRKDGYSIESSSSVGGSSASFSAFTAVGSAWDVVVYSGGVDTDGLLSLQVTKHDSSKDLNGATTS